MKNAKRFMNHRGHVIYYNEYGFMVANGDRTDKYFSTWEDAMAWIDEIEDAKQISNMEAQNGKMVG